MKSLAREQDNQCHRKKRIRVEHNRFFFSKTPDAYQFFVQQTLAQHEIGMRKVSDCFQHDLNRDVQIVIVMKLIDFQYGQVGFQIIRVLLGLHFHVVFERGQVLRIVPEKKEKNDEKRITNPH